MVGGGTSIIYWPITGTEANSQCLLHALVIFIGRIYIIVMVRMCVGSWFVFVCKRLLIAGKISAGWSNSISKVMTELYLCLPGYHSYLYSGMGYQY